MARLEKFSGTQTLPGTRQPQVVADTAVGEATEGFGAQIQKSAGAAAGLAELMQKHRDQVANLEAERTKQQIVAAQKQRESDARKNLAPGAMNLTEAMLASFDEAGKLLLKDQPPSLKDRLAVFLSDKRSEEVQRYAEMEYDERQSYFRTEVSNVFQSLITGVREEPGKFQNAYATMENLVADTPLPGAEKRSLLASGAEGLREAWFKSLPPAEQLQQFADLNGTSESDSAFAERDLRKREPIADRSDSSVSAQSGTQGEAKIEARGLLAALPQNTRVRLEAEAREEMALAAVEESARIAERLETDHRLLDPLDIQESQRISKAQKAGLLDVLEKRARDDQASLAALNSIYLSDASNPFSNLTSRQIEQAYAHLTSRGADPYITAREIYRSCKQVPVGFAVGLRKSLRSMDQSQVGTGFKNLAALARIDPNGVRCGKGGRGLNDAMTKWRVLTEMGGASDLEAAKLLAHANDPERRSQLVLEARTQKQIAGASSGYGNILARLAGRST
ncbi:hypothetical protein [Roseibium sp. M-1]